MIKNTIVKSVLNKLIRYYFTLLELLIVIAIISILTALLLPSLSKVKAQMGRTACLNVERQTGNAFMLYLQDNNDFYPPYRDYGSPEKYWYGGNDTYGFLAQYLGINDGWHHSPTYLLGIGVSIKTSGSVIYRNKFNCQARNDFSEGINFDYGYSSNVYSSARKGTRFRTPSRTCLLSESIQYSSFSASTASSYMGFRHSDGANVLFSDFHVSWMKHTDIPQSSLNPFWKPE